MRKLNDIIYSEPRKTFMEIMKVHTSEVPFANLLAFFFKSHEEHNLGSYFLKALLRTPCYEFLNTGKSRPLLNIHFDNEDKLNEFMAVDFKVDVEAKTGKGNRIDILIEGPEFVVCIEFKINHDLDNPLQDYTDFVKSSFPDKKHFFIVLTPFKKVPVGNAGIYFKEHNEFKQILLGHFFNEIKSHLPANFKEKEETKIYYEYFQELEQTVINRKIRSERNKVLLCLKFHFAKKYQCEFHNNILGGFLEIKLRKNRLKIRIKSTGWQLEKWSGNNEFQGIIRELNSLKTFQEVVLVLENVLNKTGKVKSLS